MSPADPRCARQRLLVEVGRDGHQKLVEARARVDEGPGCDVAQEYLRRAGVEQIEVTGPLQDFPHEPFFRYPPSRTVARGAWTALRHIRTVLKLG